MPIYYVKKGDTLVSIARKLGVTIEYLIEKNKGNTCEPNIIYY